MQNGKNFSIEDGTCEIGVEHIFLKYPDESLLILDCWKVDRIEYQTEWSNKVKRLFEYEEYEKEYAENTYFTYIYKAPDSCARGISSWAKVSFNDGEEEHFNAVECDLTAKNIYIWSSWNAKEEGVTCFRVDEVKEVVYSPDRVDKIRIV